jgi:hypothetical protein
MPRIAAPRFVRPIEACTFDHDGEAVVLSPNQIIDADDPLVRARPHLFKPLEASRQRPEVEQATAAPGEKRGARVAPIA